MQSLPDTAVRHPPAHIQQQNMHDKRSLLFLLMPSQTVSNMTAAKHTKLHLCVDTQIASNMTATEHTKLPSRVDTNT